MIACSAPLFREADHVRNKKMNIVQPSLSPSTPSPEVLARFKAIVGGKYAVTDPQEAAPYLTEERGLFSGHSPLILRPARRRKSRRSASLPAKPDRAGAAGRQHRPCRRPDPA
jgi:hypothetical protein